LLVEWELRGNDYYTKSDTAMPHNGWRHMEFDPDLGGTAWAVYQFSGFESSDVPQDLTIGVPLSPQRLYVGLPDFERGNWTIREYKNPPASLSVFLPVWQQTVSNEGNMYVAIIAWNGDRAVVDRLKLEVEIIGPAPTDVQATDGDYEDKVIITWEGIEEATGYKIYRDGETEEHLIATVGVFPGYADASCENLRQYTYWVRGLYDSAHGRMSEPDTGFRSNWQNHVIDSDGAVGMYTSAAIVEDRPAVAYYDFVQGDLKYAHAAVGVPESTEDWSVHLVDELGKSGEMASLHVIDGKPAIAYFDNEGGNLKFARALVADPTQTADWQTHTIDTEGWVGEYCSLAAIGPIPVISYFDYTYMNLKFATALGPAPSSAGDWQVHIVDDSTYVGRFTSCTEYSGRPAVTYFDEIETHLKMALATAALPASAADWAIHTVDDQGVVGTYSSLKVIDGRLAVSYHDWSNRFLKFARALVATPAGTEDWEIMVVDDAGSVGLHTSLTDISGFPVISYYDFDGSDLKVAWATDLHPKTTIDWYLRFVDTEGAVGSYTSMIVTNERPAVSYFDSSTTSLKFAWPP